MIQKQNSDSVTTKQAGRQAHVVNTERLHRFLHARMHPSIAMLLAQNLFRGVYIHEEGYTFFGVCFLSFCLLFLFSSCNIECFNISQSVSAIPCVISDSVVGDRSWKRYTNLSSHLATKHFALNVFAQGMFTNVHTNRSPS